MFRKCHSTYHSDIKNRIFRNRMIVQITFGAQKYTFFLILHTKQTKKQTYNHILGKSDMDNNGLRDYETRACAFPHFFVISCLIYN